MSGIGLVIALPRELPAGFARVSTAESGERLSPAVFRFTTTAGEITAVQTGVGKQRAAAGARRLVRLFAPQGLVSFGFAGGLRPGLAPGTLVIGEQLVPVDSRQPLAKAHQTLVEQFLEAAATECLAVQRGAVVTTEEIVAAPHGKAALALRCGASAVDMETKGIVEVAREAGLAWVAVRALVDTAEEALPAECLAVLRADGHIAPDLLLKQLWRSPWLLWNLCWLARRTMLARRRLSQAFRRWVVTLQAQRGQGWGIR